MPRVVDAASLAPLATSRERGHLDPTARGRPSSVGGWLPLSASRTRAWAFLIGLFLLLLAILLVWQVAGQPQDRFWDRIQATGRWRVGMDPSFPPFESLDAGGQPVGFDVDLARAIAARWGVDVQFEGIGFDGLIDAVWAGRVDSVISALPYQPQFSRDVAFTQPYFEAGLVLVHRVSQSEFASIDELAGAHVAVEWGSEGDVQARELKRRRFPDLAISAQETALSALQAVRDGDADVALVDRITALQFLAEADNLRIGPNEPGSAPVVGSNPYVIALPRKAPTLHKELGAALEALSEDGTLQGLTEKWFGVSPTGAQER